MVPRDATGRTPRPASRRHPAVLGLVLAVAAAQSDCPPPAADCAPFTTRCSRLGVPETCSELQRWEATGSAPCRAADEVCCRTRSPYSGGTRHACAAPADCLDEDAS